MNKRKHWQKLHFHAWCEVHEGPCQFPLLGHRLLRLVWQLKIQLETQSRWSCKVQVSQWCDIMMLSSSGTWSWVAARTWEIFFTALWNTCFRSFGSLIAMLALALREGDRTTEGRNINEGRERKAVTKKPLAKGIVKGVVQPFEEGAWALHCLEFRDRNRRHCYCMSGTDLEPGSY